MGSTTLNPNLIAKNNLTGVQVQHGAVTFSGGVNTDNDTIEMARLPAGAYVLDVKLWITDLDSSTDMEIDIGLNPAPGQTTADANVLADGLTTAVQAAGKVNALAVAPTISGEAITAGVGLRCNVDEDSVMFGTLIDNGDATSGTIYWQVWYAADAVPVHDTIDNS